MQLGKLSHDLSQVTKLLCKLLIINLSAKWLGILSSWKPTDKCYVSEFN